MLCLGSLLFPWYGIELELFQGFSQTGFEAFSFAHAALAVTAAAALVLVFRCARGYRPPRPLSEGGLLALAGLWAALIVGYLAVDHPEEIAGFGHVRIRYGLLVALAGAGALLIGGMRLRMVAAAERATPV
jgi:hypothetical protein